VATSKRGDLDYSNDWIIEMVEETGKNLNVPRAALPVESQNMCARPGVQGKHVRSEATGGKREGPIKRLLSEEKKKRRGLGEPPAATIRKTTRGRRPKNLGGGRKFIRTQKREVLGCTADLPGVGGLGIMQPQKGENKGNPEGTHATEMESYEDLPVQVCHGGKGRKPPKRRKGKNVLLVNMGRGTSKPSLVYKGRSTIRKKKKIPGGKPKVS